MIVQEPFEVNGRGFVRTTSDAGRFVVRDGVSYEEACDPAELGRGYTECGLIPSDEAGAERVLNILLGEGVSI